MIRFALVSTVLVLIFSPALAKPNGVYHQEYNYKSSSSSYRNNELQHQNENEGFYSKDGDLEGRLRPKVNAHSQHSEYTNPKLQQQGYQVGDGTSYGQLNAQSGSAGGFRSGDFGYGQLNSQQAAHHYPIYGGGGAASAGSSQASFHSSSSQSQQSYGVTSDLSQVTQDVETKLQRELQHAIMEQYRRASAGYAQVTQSQMRNDLRELEEQLRRNVSMRVQDAVRTRYGAQGVRGGYSYTLQEGRLQPTANYNNQELEDLTRNLQNDLVHRLEEQMQQTYFQTSSSVTTQRSVLHHQVRPEPIIVRPHHNPVGIPERPVYQQYPRYPQDSSVIVNNRGESLTTIATRVQTDLNEHLNRILDDTQRRYFSTNGYAPNLDVDVLTAQLQQELRSNISLQLQNEVRKQYGYEAERKRDDIENLQRQIEQNLIAKLNRELTKQHERYYEASARTHQTIYATHRPVNIYYPADNNYVQQQEQQVDYNQQAEMSHIQRQVQEDMSRQIQAALLRQQHRNYATPQAMLQQLTAELNRNLTRQLEQYQEQYREQYGGASGGNYQSNNYEAQLAEMRNRLQSDLMKELQQGVQQQSYSRYSSWSSSSSSSSSANNNNNNNYRPVRGFDPTLYRAYGNVGLNVAGEDCGGMLGDDPNAFQRRQKRYSTSYHRDSAEIADEQQHLEDFDDLTQKIEDPLDGLEQHRTQQYRQKYDNGGLYSHPNEDPTHSQKVLDEEDLTQKQEDILAQSQHLEDLTQKRVEELVEPSQNIDQEDLTQKVEPQSEIVEEPDLTQKVEPLEFQEPSQPVEEPAYVRRTVQPSGTGTYSQSYSRGYSRPSYSDIFEPRPKIESSSANPKPEAKPLYNQEQEFVDDSFLSNQVHVDPLDDERPLQKTDDQDDLNQKQEDIDFGTEITSTTTEEPKLSPVYAVELTQINDQNQLDGPAIAQHYEDQFIQSLVGVMKQKARQNESQNTGNGVQNETAEEPRQEDTSAPVLNQETGLNQQSSDLNQQSPSLNQQSSDLNQESTGLNEQSLYLYQQPLDLNQQSSNFNQQSSDLNQQSSDLNQQSSDLNQQSSGLNQQSSGLNQQSSGLSQQSSDLNQQSSDLNQQSVIIQQQPSQDEIDRQTDLLIEALRQKALQNQGSNAQPVQTGYTPLQNSYGSNQPFGQVETGSALFQNPYPGSQNYPKPVLTGPNQVQSPYSRGRQNGRGYFNPLASVNTNIEPVSTGSQHVQPAQSLGQLGYQSKPNVYGSRYYGEQVQTDSTRTVPTYNQPKPVYVQAEIQPIDDSVQQVQPVGLSDYYGSQYGLSQVSKPAQTGYGHVTQPVFYHNPIYIPSPQYQTDQFPVYSGNHFPIYSQHYHVQDPVGHGYHSHNPAYHSQKPVSTGYQSISDYSGQYRGQTNAHSMGLGSTYQRTNYRQKVEENSSEEHVQTSSTTETARNQSEEAKSQENRAGNSEEVQNVRNVKGKYQRNENSSEEN